MDYWSLFLILGIINVALFVTAFILHRADKKKYSILIILINSAISFILPMTWDAIEGTGAEVTLFIGILIVNMIVLLGALMLDKNTDNLFNVYLFPMIFLFAFGVINGLFAIEPFSYESGWWLYIPSIVIIGVGIFMLIKVETMIGLFTTISGGIGILISYFFSGKIGLITMAIIASLLIIKNQRIKGKISKINVSSIKPKCEHICKIDNDPKCNSCKL